MASLYFASSNENKFLEIQNILETDMEKIKTEIYFSKVALKEIQSESIVEVAEDKAKKAFESIGKPVIVEDDGLFIEDLNGFPGVYSSFVFKTIGNKGILTLLGNNGMRRAHFMSIFSFSDGKTIETFFGETTGHITTEIYTAGWGFDPIFKPENENITYGELNTLKKNKISHRSKAFRQFLRWYRLKYNHRHFSNEAHNPTGR
jgi:XTP/dITP diphosphohydrolase